MGFYRPLICDEDLKLDTQTCLHIEVVLKQQDLSEDPRKSISTAFLSIDTFTLLKIVNH